MAYPYTQFGAGHEDGDPDDTNDTHPEAVLVAAEVNAWENALNDLLTELGAAPKGAYGNLTLRLAAMDSTHATHEYVDDAVAAHALEDDPHGDRAYADGIAQGLTLKDNVRVATTANITLSGTQTVDGVALSVGDDVLVKNQTSGAANGVYEVASGAWTRRTDLDTSAEMSTGVSVLVLEGTSNGGTRWVLTTPSPDLGFTALTFTQFDLAADVNAGDGLTKSGNTLSVGEGEGIIVNADDIEADPAVVVFRDTLDTAGHPPTLDDNGQLAESVLRGSASASSTVTTSYAVDLSDADTEAWHRITLTASTACTISVTGVPAEPIVVAVTFEVTGAASATLTWPGTVTWASGLGVAPDAAEKRVYTLVTTDGGTTWRGYGDYINDIAVEAADGRIGTLAVQKDTETIAAAARGIELNRYGGQTGVHIGRAEGTAGTPTAVGSGTLADLSFDAYNGTAWARGVLELRATSTETHSTTAAGMSLGIRTTRSSRTVTLCTTTSGSAAVTVDSSSTGAFGPQDVGRIFTHANVPAGTTIASVTTGRSITLSANATASGAATATVSSVTPREVWRFDHRGHLSGGRNGAASVTNPAGAYFQVGDSATVTLSNQLGATGGEPMTAAFISDTVAGQRAQRLLHLSQDIVEGTLLDDHYVDALRLDIHDTGATAFPGATSPYAQSARHTDIQVWTNSNRKVFGGDTIIVLNSTATGYNTGIVGHEFNARNDCGTDNPGGLVTYVTSGDDDIQFAQLLESDTGSTGRIRWGWIINDGTGTFSSAHGPSEGLVWYGPKADGNVPEVAETPRFAVLLDGDTYATSLDVVGTGGDGYLTVAHQSSAPASPAAGSARVYAKSDGWLYAKTSAGVERAVAATIIAETHPATPTVPVDNTTSDTTLVALTVPAGTAKAGDTLRLRVHGDVTNNSVGAVTFQWRFKLGTTSMVTSTAVSLAQSANPRKYLMEFEIDVVDPTGATAPSQRAAVRGFIGSASTGDMAWNTGTNTAAGHGTAQINLDGANRDVTVSVQPGTADANAEVSLHGAILEIVRRA